MTERDTHIRAEGWLRRAVRSAPHPLPAGRFPQIMAQAAAAGFERETMLNVLDEWLNYGYVRVTDPLANDIVVLPAGEDMLVAGPPKTEDEKEQRASRA